MYVSDNCSGVDLMDYELIKKTVKEKFRYSEKSFKRFNHMEEVVTMALFLNKRFDFKVDENKIKIAGILHDYTKELPFEESLKIVEKYLSGKELEIAKKSESVIHSFTAYYVVKEEFGIVDEEILKAILYHTTGAPKMSKLAELIFVADAIEETRTYTGVEDLRNAVIKDFYQGMLLIIETTLKHLKEKGWYINPKTIDTYNYYWRIYGNNK